jgi:hypothetical protein
MRRDPADRDDAIMHEAQRGDVRRMSRENRLGFRPLQRHQREFVGAPEPHVRRQLRFEMRVVVFLAAGVHDQMERAWMAWIGGAGDHEIVEDAAILVQELRVALLMRLEVEDVGRAKRFQRRRRGLVPAVVGQDKGLAHMRHVEQAGAAARPVVFGDDARRILDRHVVAGERNHARAQRAVAFGERRGFQGRVGGGTGHSGSPDNRSRRRPRPVARPLCP